MGLGLPFVFPAIYERVDPVSPLMVVNVAAVGLALLLTQGPWRRGAASFTLTLAFWMALYSTLSLVYWRGTIKDIERVKALRIEDEKFWEPRLDTLPKRASPPYRPLVRAELEQMISRADRDTDRLLKERSERATEWRNVFLLSLSCSLLCAVGATRSLRELERRGIRAVHEPDLQFQ
jgi:hypothetical protein